MISTEGELTREVDSTYEQWLQFPVRVTADPGYIEHFVNLGNPGLPVRDYRFHPKLKVVSPEEIEGGYQPTRLDRHYSGVLRAMAEGRSRCQQLHRETDRDTTELTMVRMMNRFIRAKKKYPLSRAVYRRTFIQLAEAEIHPRPGRYDPWDGEAENYIVWIDLMIEHVELRVEKYGDPRLKRFCEIVQELMVVCACKCGSGKMIISQARADSLLAEMKRLDTMLELNVTYQREMKPVTDIPVIAERELKPEPRPEPKVTKIERPERKGKIMRKLIRFGIMVDRYGNVKPLPDHLRYEQVEEPAEELEEEIVEVVPEKEEEKKVEPAKKAKPVARRQTNEIVPIPMDYDDEEDDEEEEDDDDDDSILNYKVEKMNAAEFNALFDKTSLNDLDRRGRVYRTGSDGSYNRSLSRPRPPKSPEFINDLDDMEPIPGRIIQGVGTLADSPMNINWIHADRKDIGDIRVNVNVNNGPINLVQAWDVDDPFRGVFEMHDDDDDEEEDTRYNRYSQFDDYDDEDDDEDEDEYDDDDEEDDDTEDEYDDDEDDEDDEEEEDDDEQRADELLAAHDKLMCKWEGLNPRKRKKVAEAERSLNLIERELKRLQARGVMLPYRYKHRTFFVRAGRSVKWTFKNLWEKLVDNTEVIVALGSLAAAVGFVIRGGTTKMVPVPNPS